MFNKRIVTKMADRLETDARTTLGYQVTVKHDKDYKWIIKMVRNEIKV